MIKFVQKHTYILLFGFFQIFFSAPGQTFLISLFVSPIFDDMGISQTKFAGLYSAATLSAALLLNPAGRLIDRFCIKKIIKFVTLTMCCACFILGNAHNIPVLFIGFFLLRLTGQGVFGLTASILMVKKFAKNRGKSMGFITLGFPFSEAFYPYIAVTLLSLIGWRYTYMTFGLTTIFIMLPLQLYLIKKANLVHGEFLEGETLINPQRLRGNPEARKIRPHKDFNLSEVLRDKKFYLILSASCLPPMVVTGLFFHQQSLYTAHQWNIELAVSGLAIYAFCKAIGSVSIGAFVDKHGPLPIFILLILMLGLGTLFAALGGSTLMLFLYYAFIGTALGFSSPVMNVVYPYFYGTKHIGSIKGMISTVRNGVTALAPLPIAITLDNGGDVTTILYYLAFFIIGMSVIPLIVWKMDQ